MNANKTPTVNQHPPAELPDDSAPDIEIASESDSPPRRGIQSVTIGFRVLAALAAEREPVSLGTVAKRSELSASQAHRYLASLIASGMAHQDASSGRYDLGPQAIQIGLAALARTDVFALADPAIAAFTRETGRTTLVAARGPLGPTIVRWHAGRTPVTTSLAVGSVLPLLRSATGHVFLSFMNAEEIHGALVLEETTTDHNSNIDPAAIRRKVRETMSASVDEMLIPGLRATAVPILDIQQRAALVVTVMATLAFDRRNDHAVVDRLKQVCRGLSEKIGGRWPVADDSSVS
jgi:DNA-binding IclR family transcriptional regulator